MNEFLKNQAQYIIDGVSYEYVYYMKHNNIGYVLKNISKYVLDKEYFSDVYCFIGFQLKEGVKVITPNIRAVHDKLLRANKDKLYIVLIQDGSDKVITGAGFLLELFEPYMLEEVYNV